jgi:hypothetical protein
MLHLLERFVGGLPILTIATVTVKIAGAGGFEPGNRIIGEIPWETVQMTW